MEEKIKKYMSKLGISEAEARQIIEDDERINSGEKLFELTAEQKKASDRARSMNDNKVYTFSKKRTRKADVEKKEVTDALISAVKSIGAEVTEVINPEREFMLSYKGINYKVVVSKPRAKK